MMAALPSSSACASRSAKSSIVRPWRIGPWSSVRRVSAAPTMTPRSPYCASSALPPPSVAN
eukprot:418675-Prymnesium_polylepis.1